MENTLALLHCTFTIARLSQGENVHLANMFSDTAIGTNLLATRNVS